MRRLDGRPLPPPVPADRVVRRPHQVHGWAVAVVGLPAPPGTLSYDPGRGAPPPDADAVVGASTGDVLAVLVADCAPVALGSPSGLHAAVHAGWRGVRGGVVGEAVGVMRRLGADSVVAGLGPCIGPCCYEFSEEALDGLAAHFGEAVRGVTTRGTPSFDLRAAVTIALQRAEVTVATPVVPCTACTPGYFSHRARRDHARQAVLVWRD